MLIIIVYRYNVKELAKCQRFSKSIYISLKETHLFLAFKLDYQDNKVKNKSRNKFRVELTRSNNNLKRSALKPTEENYTLKYDLLT